MAPRDAPDNPQAARPFLKWTGGKQWLMPLFARCIQVPNGTYREPFLGGGSAFFSIGPRRARLSDSNAELIETYCVVRDSVEPLIDELRTYPHDRAFYDRLRREIPEDSVRRAARFVYLNKTAFNGMYRVNRKGEFNVPFGSFVRPGICQPDRLRAASRALAGVELKAEGYVDALATCQPGDTVYLDPPYITSHLNNGFARYNEHLFSWSDQTKLAALAVDLVKAGVHVLATNASHEPLIRLYAGFFRYSITRNSLIAGPVDKRGMATEIIFSSRGLAGMTPDPD